MRWNNYLEFHLLRLLVQRSLSSPFFQRLMGEAMSRRIRGLFNAANFWAIVLYNVLALNSLDFAKLVANRLIFKGGKRFCKKIEPDNSGSFQKQQNLLGRCPWAFRLLNIVSCGFSVTWQDYLCLNSHSKHKGHRIPFKSYLSVCVSAPFFLPHVLVLSSFCAVLISSQDSPCPPSLCCWWPTAACSWWKSGRESKPCWRSWRRPSRKQNKPDRKTDFFFYRLHGLLPHVLPIVCLVYCRDSHVTPKSSTGLVFRHKAKFWTVVNPKVLLLQIIMPSLLAQTQWWWQNGRKIVKLTMCFKS